MPVVPGVAVVRGGARRRRSCRSSRPTVGSCRSPPWYGLAEAALDAAADEVADDRRELAGDRRDRVELDRWQVAVDLAVTSRSSGRSRPGADRVAPVDAARRSRPGPAAPPGRRARPPRPGCVFCSSSATSAVGGGVGEVRVAALSGADIGLLGHAVRAAAWAAAAACSAADAANAAPVNVASLRPSSLRPSTRERLVLLRAPRRVRAALGVGGGQSAGRRPPGPGGRERARQPTTGSCRRPPAVERGCQRVPCAGAPVLRSCRSCCRNGSSCGPQRERAVGVGVGAGDVGADLDELLDVVARGEQPPGLAHERALVAVW